jgi:quercetin dioxygenase-like cupin family protein
MKYKHVEGKVQRAKFLVDASERLPERMCNSDATGLPLLKAGPFAADLIRFPAGGKVDLHTHPGNHMLFCVDGSGTVQYGDKLYELSPGVCYLIEGQTAHAVFANNDSQLTLIAIADEHREVNSTTRLDMCDKP